MSGASQLRPLHTTGITSHQLVVLGLDADTAYNVDCLLIDASGGVYRTDSAAFTTLSSSGEQLGGNVALSSLGAVVWRRHSPVLGDTVSCRAVESPRVTSAVLLRARVCLVVMLDLHMSSQVSGFSSE